MPFHTAAFYSSVDPAGAFVNLAAISDQAIFTSGNDLRVPALPQLVCAAAGVASGGQGLVRVESPSLRDNGRLYVSPVNGNADASAEPDTPPKVHDLRDTPLVLTTDEILNAFVHSNPTVAAVQWLIAWLADAVIAPVTSGEMLSIRFTTVGNLVAGAWTNLNIALDEALTIGRYQVVGLRGVSAGLIALRVVFRGGPWRPGVLGCDSDGDLDAEIFRRGGMGVFGEFEATSLPSIDFLSLSADANPYGFVDLIKAA